MEGSRLIVFLLVIFTSLPTCASFEFFEKVILQIKAWKFEKWPDFEFKGKTCASTAHRIISRIILRIVFAHQQKFRKIGGGGGVNPTFFPENLESFCLQTPQYTRRVKIVAYQAIVKRAVIRIYQIEL